MAKLTKRTTRAGPEMVRIVAMAFVSALMIFVVSCNEIAEWRDRQIQQSHTAAQQGGPVLPPAVPITVPGNVLESLPVNDSFTFTHYTKHGNIVELKAISPWDTATTSNWMLARLAELGYESGDNPSRILEGCDYFGGSETVYSSIWAKVDLNSADQCLVEIETREH